MSTMSLLFTILLFHLAVGAYSVGVSEVTECPAGPPMVSCGESRSDFPACLMASLRTDVMNLGSGISSLGLPALNPLKFIDPISLQTADGNSATLYPCTLFGASNVVMSNFAADFPAQVNYTLRLPDFRLRCDYNMDAGFLNAPTANWGRFALRAHQYISNFSLAGSLPETCGEKYLTYLSASSTFVRSDTFQPFFSGLSTQFSDADLRPLLVPALEKEQNSVSIKYLASFTSLLPPINTWVPPSTSYLSFCMARRPSC